MIALTDEQRQELESGKAIDVTDRETARSYVVLRKDVYERVRQLLYDDTEWTEADLRRQLAQSSADNGWDEPGMEVHDHYEEDLRKRCL